LAVELHDPARLHLSVHRISIPFSIWLLIGYLETVPRELDEAAIVDGCTPLGALWRVMLPGVVATMAHAFLLCWTEYLLALAFPTRPAMKTLPALLLFLPLQR
jgi:ABC-type glycerol-3-phosphate transport system permease component